MHDKRNPQGIRVRHARNCPVSTGRGCACRPSFEAFVYLPAEGRKVRKTFGTEREARQWRASAMHALREGKLRGPTRRTLREEAEIWQKNAESGEHLTRGARRYKPAVIRGVESDFRLHINPRLGGRKLHELTRRDVQSLVDHLRAHELSGSKIRGVVTSLKIVLRRAIQDDEIATDPTQRLRLPAPAGTRDRVISLDEAQTLLEALPMRLLRPLYATALYAGLRRGELRALRWRDVDLAEGVIHVTRSMDDKEGEIEPKSSAGLRDVPVAPPLRDALVEWKASSRGRADDFVFPGRSMTVPFTSTNVRRQASAAWESFNEQERKQAQLEGREPALLVPIGLHELRHTWVSHMAASGFSLEEIAPFAGHSTSWMTERYRHLLPGAAADAALRFGEYLERANTAGRLAQLGR